jgi:transcriptional antiterminator RfaH
MEVASSPSAEPFLKKKGGRARSCWYCIRTHLKHEHIASAHLRQIPGVEVFNPQLRVMRSTRHGRRWSTESLFPNYVFANFVLESGLEKITYTPAVKMVLRFGGRVPEIPDAVIEDLRQAMAALDSRVLTDAPMEAEEVEITHGVFAGMKASVTRVLPGKQRAQILLDVMGRPVSAELSLDLVLFNRRDAAQFALTPAESIFADRPGAPNFVPASP